MKHRRSAFTMLEVILAMGMVAMIAASLFSSLRLGFRARDTAQNGMVAPRTAQIVMDAIRRDLETAVPPTGNIAPEFVGDRAAGGDSLKFYAIMASNGDGLSAPGVRHLGYGLASQPNSTAMLVRYVTANLLSPTEVEPEQEILCRNVTAFTLRYFDGTSWQETWDSTSNDNLLPLAIEVTLEFNVTGRDTPYRMVRVVNIPCAHDPENEQTGQGGTP